MREAISPAERTIEDLNTGETLTFLETAEESGGARVVMQLTLAPGARVGLHSHPIVETFSLIEGELDFELDGRSVELGRREAVVVPAGHLHGMHNRSSRPAVLKVVGTPGAEAEFGLRVKFLLSRDGYLPTPGGGRPKDPLLGMVVIDRGGLYFPPLPRPLFRVLIGALAAIGRGLGRERFLLSRYPEYRRYLEALGTLAPPSGGGRTR